MDLKSLRKINIGHLKVEPSGHAWIPKPIFYSGPKVKGIVKACSMLFKDKNNG